MTTATSPAPPGVTVTVSPNGRWAGVLGMMNTWSADNRMLAAPENGPVRARPLPLPLLVQPELASGHDGGKLGIGVIDRIWTKNGAVMGEGRFDMDDPLGAQLARKVGLGFIRFVSLDVDDATAQQVVIGEDGRPCPDCDPNDPAYELGQVYSGWRVMGATLLAHPAFPDAHISLADAEGLALTAAAYAEIVGYDPQWGCVRPEGDGWVPADCTEETAVPASPTGDGPFDPEGRAPTEEMPPPPDDATGQVPTEGSQPIAEDDATDDTDTVTDRLPAEPTAAEVEEAEQPEDDGSGCVAPDPDNEGAWVPAACDTEGAVPANADGTAPAEAVTDAANTAAEMSFAVDTSLPWAPREREWDGAAAADRVEAWATPEGAETFDPDRMTRAFLVVDGPPENKGSYKFGVADVIDGELRLVWSGVVAANGALSGARSEPAISSEQMASANAAVRTLYRQAAEAFDDPSITESESVQTAITTFPSGGGDTTPAPADSPETDCECEREGEWVPCDCDTEGARRRDTPPDTDSMGTVPADCEPCQAVTITAAAADTFAPGWTPPAEWFAPPQASQAMAIQIHPDTGRVAGWLADWTSCHVGYSNRCITPPHSATDYSYFNIRPVRTNEGVVYCGLLTMDTGHASLNAGAQAAMAHYDNTGTQVAVVRVGEDSHGIWAAGAVLPFISEEQRLRLSLASFSGDWRDIRGGTELIAALAVNSPGFPMPQVRTGEDNRPYALVAAGALQPPREPARPAARPAGHATANINLDAGAVAALVIKELDAREERHRRTAAATAVLNRFKAADTARRVQLARARVIRPVGDFPQPGRLAKEDVEFAKNWIDQQGGLPPYIRRIADHLQERGMDTSRAIATAVNVVKKMCSTGDTNWPGLQRVNATSRTQACSAVARWEAMKAAARAD